ncbi:uncharacterized protein [Musca autumnalis]|uniref:uncharacterized protein n=1 Tax=Musca autumnalis TaxID=221902 RepID=UPI003CECA7FF
MPEEYLKVVYDSQNKIWKSVNYPYGDVTKLSLGEKFLQTMRSTDPTKIIDHFYDKNILKSVKEVYEQAILIAINLKQLGIKKGDCVIFFTLNNEWIAVLTFGCILCGAVPLYFEVHLDKESTSTLFDVVQPMAMLYEEQYLQKIEESLKCCKNLKQTPHLIAINGEKEPNVKNLISMNPESKPVDFANFRSVRIDDTKEETAILVLTSGSTGLPKVVQLTHALVMHGVAMYWDNAENWENIDENSVVFSFSPLRWISQIQLLFQSMLFGLKRISSCIVTKQLGLELLRNSDITHFLGVPTLCYEILLLLDENDTESLKSVRKVMFGGETPTKAVFELSIKHAVNATHYYRYGMSEMGSVICCDRYFNGGKLMPGYELQILDDRLQPLGVNKPGQIALRPPFPLKGYMSLDNSVYYNERGLFINGDYGFMDEYGKLHILARYKNLIKFNCEVIIPDIFDAILAYNIPEIYVARLVGYRTTQNDGNQVGACFVILKPNVTLSHAEISKKVMDTLKLHLNEKQFPIIQDVHIIDAIPTIAQGKDDRIALSKLAAAKSYNI